MVSRGVCPIFTPNSGKHSVILLFVVLEIVAPVFLLAGIGFIWVKLGFEYRIEFVTRLAMTLAVPCLIFTALMKSQADLGALGGIALAAALAYLGLGIIFMIILSVAGLDRRTYLAPLIFGNTGNLGLPVALFAFGQAGLELAVVILSVSAVLSFTIGIWLVAGRGSAGKILREPMIWATFLGAVFLWQGWETPQFVTRTLDLTGQMAIPMMLLTLGVAVARLNTSRLTLATALSLGRAVICVVVAWCVGLLFGLEQTAFGVLVLQIAMPVAVTAYLLAEKFEADAEAVAGLVMISTLIAVPTLPLILSFLLVL